MKTNTMLMALITALKDKARKDNVGLWCKVAEDLSLQTNLRREVNVYKINQYSKDNQTVIVPGKVLGVGELDHKVTVAAFAFSAKAREAINKKGRCISIEEAMSMNLKPSEVRVLG